MRRFAWVYLLIGLAVAAVGGFVYVHEREISTTATVERTQSSSQVIVVQPRRSDEELRKEIEGFGSIKKLKPVQLPSAPQGKGDK